MPQTVSAGVFWIDEDDILEVEPAERLALARRYMPLPAAFREAASSLRALIRVRSRELDDGSDLLSDLYLTAAQHSFLLAETNVPGVGSRYKVAASIPRNVWERLPMPYPAIGYRHLPLLDRTDHDWLVVAWGEPETHSTAQAYHQSVWDDCVARYSRYVQHTHQPERSVGAETWDRTRYAK